MNRNRSLSLVQGNAFAMTFPVNQCTIIYSKYLRWFTLQSVHHAHVVQFTIVNLEMVQRLRHEPI